MAFRRSGEAGPTGSRWRLAHRALLRACGVPDAVADSDRRLAYVLLHGDDYPGTGWDVSRVSPPAGGRSPRRVGAGALGGGVVRPAPSAPPTGGGGGLMGPLTRQ